MKITVREITVDHVLNNVTVRGIDSLHRRYHGKLESLRVTRRINGAATAITLGIRTEGGGYLYHDFMLPFDEEVTVEDS